MPHPKSVRIDVVSDVVVPGASSASDASKRRFALNPDVPVEVHWQPYFLNDWIPREGISRCEGISREEYLTTKFGSPERYKDIAKRVSFPKIISGRIGGAVQPGWKRWQWRQIVGPLDAKAHLSLIPSGCVLDCNTPHRRKELAAGAPRRR